VTWTRSERGEKARRRAEKNEEQGLGRGMGKPLWGGPRLAGRAGGAGRKEPSREPACQQGSSTASLRNKRGTAG
jgi:hypothetical protein